MGNIKAVDILAPPGHMRQVIAQKSLATETRDLLPDFLVGLSQTVIYIYFTVHEKSWIP
jgi:hypothetical protein